MRASDAYCSFRQGAATKRNRTTARCRTLRSISPGCGWRSSGRNGAGLTLPFLAANRLPQQKIFEDEFPFASRKRSTAATAGDPPIDSLWPSFDFDDLIERVAIRAIDKCRLIAHAQSPTHQVDDILTRRLLHLAPYPGRFKCSASLAMFAAMRRASARVSQASLNLCMVVDVGAWSTPRVMAALAGVIHDRQGATCNDHKCGQRDQ